MADRCFAAGYQNGPMSQGGDDEGYLCELDSGHEGDHAWNTMRLANVPERVTVTWPVRQYDGFIPLAAGNVVQYAAEQQINVAEVMNGMADWLRKEGYAI